MENRKKYLMISGICFAYVTLMRVLVLRQDLAADKYGLLSIDGILQLILVISCLLISLSFFLAKPALSAVGCLGCAIHAFSDMGISIYWTYRVATDFGMEYNDFYAVCELFTVGLWVCQGTYFLFLFLSFVRRRSASSFYIGAIIFSCVSFVFFMIALLWFEIRSLIFLDILEYAARTLVPIILYVSLKNTQQASMKTTPEVL